MPSGPCGDVGRHRRRSRIEAPAWHPNRHRSRWLELASGLPARMSPPAWPSLPRLRHDWRGRIDPMAAGAPLGFRVLIASRRGGVLAAAGVRAGLRACTAPPAEPNAHRRLRRFPAHRQRGPHDPAAAARTALCRLALGVLLPVLVLILAGRATGARHRVVAGRGARSGRPRRGDAMSHTYRAIGWNRRSGRYDAVLARRVAPSWCCWPQAAPSSTPNATGETLAHPRATGVTGLLLLHVILTIGPLCRLDARFLPLLYNRRHMGVTMFLLALGMACSRSCSSTGSGDVNPLVSLLTTSNATTDDRGLPVPGARGGRARHPGGHGRDEPRLLAADAHGACLEGCTWASTSPTRSCCTWRSACCSRSAAPGSRRCSLLGGVLWIGLHAVAALREASATRPRGHAGRSWTCAPWPTSRRSARRWRALPGNASPSSATTGASRRSRTCASTRTGRSAKDGSSTAAWSARGTATSIGPTAARLPPVHRARADVQRRLRGARARGSPPAPARHAG
jgi:hypothetical protein